MAWWRLRIVKRDESFSLIFFLTESEYMELELRSVESRGPMRQGARPRGVPPLLWTRGGSPLVDSFTNTFYLFQKYSS